jgi:hypothetical protein
VSSVEAAAAAAAAAARRAARRRRGRGGMYSIIPASHVLKIFFPFFSVPLQILYVEYYVFTYRIGRGLRHVGA